MAPTEPETPVEDIEPPKPEPVAAPPKTEIPAELPKDAADMLAKMMAAQGK